MGSQAASFTSFTIYRWDLKDFESPTAVSIIHGIFSITLSLIILYLIGETVFKVCLWHEHIFLSRS